MFYENEEDTLSYILRASGRLQSKTGLGFTLMDANSTPVCFCWIADFEGFEMKELKTRLSAPSQKAAIIFDGWTPQSKRRRGYFGIALSMAARCVSKSGKEPWTFSAVTNHSSRRGIERAGFERKYSMIFRKTLAWQRVSKAPFDGPASSMEAQAGS